MPKLKEVIAARGKTQKEVAEALRKKDKNIDRSMLNKFVNYVCLPKPSTTSDICEILDCDVLDLYDVIEMDMLSMTTKKRKPSIHGSKDFKSHGEHIYNLTVEIDRKVAWQIFSKKALNMLGYKTKSEMIRDLLNKELKKYEHLLAKEKATQDNIAESGSSSQQ